MLLLTAGLIVWSLVHLAPSLGVKPRQAVIDRMGFDAYRGLFSLIVIGSVVMIVMGWRSSIPQYMYAVSAEMRTIAIVLTAFSFLCLGASGRPSRIGRFIRHPQLTGVLIWCWAHLLANGDSRSVVLFTGLGAWCVLEMFVINRRDGDWVKQDAPPLPTDLIAGVLSLAVMGALMWAHQWLSGVPLL